MKLPKYKNQFGYVYNNIKHRWVKNVGITVPSISTEYPEESKIHPLLGGAPLETLLNEKRKLQWSISEKKRIIDMGYASEIKKEKYIKEIKYNEETIKDIDEIIKNRLSHLGGA